MVNKVTILTSFATKNNMYFDIKGNPLHWVGMTLFKYHNFFEEFNINENTFSKFLENIENLYRLENPYHNNIHAADVVCSLRHFLNLL